MATKLTSFFAGVDTAPCFMQLFDQLSDVCLFIKNPDSELIYGNRCLLDRLDLASLSDLEGTMDSDHFPAEMCEAFVKDDEAVFTTLEPIENRIELGFNGRFNLVWYSTSKIPVVSKKGVLKGLVGISRIQEDEKVAHQLSQVGIFQLVKWLNEHSNRRVTTKEMAKVAGLSIWQLRKRFQEVLAMTPQEFELASRIRRASQALTDNNKTISEIALEFGFCDQSAFSNQFKNRIGFSPTEFRERKAGRD
ncbi:MAG: helix-turn-helix domain-containing protein [Verrucomicrobiales bacterium]|nr:helix-turn-helix domain-containing protein [Verrucomicrobiales bacterium]